MADRGQLRLRAEPLTLFAMLVTLATAVALATGHQWRPENEVAVGPVSVPLFTALFFGSLLPSLRTPQTAFRSVTRFLPTRLGYPFTYAAIGLTVLGIVSTASAGGAPFGYVFYASFIAWPMATAAAATRTVDTSTYPWMIVALAIVGLLAGRGLRVFPDNINLVGMIFSSSALYLMATSKRPLLGYSAALLALAVLILDGRRTLGLSHLIAMYAIAGHHYLRRGRASAALIPATVAAACVALALAVGWVTTSPGGLGYLGSVVDFFDSGERLATDERRAQLMQAGIEAIEDHPLVGIGGGRYLEHLDDSGVPEDLQVRPHNLLIFLWAELGVVGFVLALVLLLAPLVHLSRTSIAWIALLPPTFSMLTNDYYFSPGYFTALLLVTAGQWQKSSQSKEPRCLENRT